VHELLARLRRKLAAIGGRIDPQQSGDFGGVLRRVLQRDDATATVADEHEAFESRASATAATSAERPRTDRSPSAGFADRPWPRKSSAMARRRGRK